MKRIGITLFANDGGKSGISQYMIHIVQQLQELDTTNTYFLFIAKQDQALFPIKAPNFKLIPTSNIVNNPILNLLWHQTILVVYILRLRLSVMFYPAANRRLSWYNKIHSVGTIHDLAQRNVKKKYDGYRMFYLNQILSRLSHRLSVVITPSLNTKTDIMTHYKIPEKHITVIHNGYNSNCYYPRPATEVQPLLIEKYHLTTPYILYISRIEHPGKNHVRLIQAFHRLYIQHTIPHQLLFVGSLWHGSEAIFDEIQNRELTDKVRHLGFVDYDDLPRLLSGAALFVFPSLYEGFGIPVIEAMACGIPVACSNTSSLPEIAGDAAELFNPYQPDDICRAMEIILTDEANEIRREKGFKQAAKFTWTLSAEQTLSQLHRP